MKAEEKRQAARGKTRKKKPRPLRRGRLATADKLALAQREENVFPEGLDPQQCKFSHSRPVWRLEDGRAVLVAYHVFRGGRNQFGKVPGSLGRNEFGIEIVIAIAIAYQVYILGLTRRNANCDRPRRLARRAAPARRSAALAAKASCTAFWNRFASNSASSHWERSLRKFYVGQK